MNLLSPATIKELLSAVGAKPNKTLGQNFLIDKNVLNKIITAANITKEDVVVEIGPGIGALTSELSIHAQKVIAIEKDQGMVEILATTVKNRQNVEVIREDALTLNPNQYTQSQKYKVIANIPYYITSPLIRLFLEAENPPQQILLMVQKEVAQRICAKPPNMSLLAVSVQYYAEPKIISYVSRGCFWPAPNVDSAILKIIPLNVRKTTAESEKFFDVVKAGFSQPRKQLLNNLSTILKKDRAQTIEWLQKCGIEPNQRAETLSVKQWEKLVENCG